MRTSRRTHLGFVAAVLIASPVDGQIVQGRLLDEETSEPVPGATVHLLDDRGTDQGAVLSNRGGHFRIRAPSPGDYRLQITRIGVAALTSGPIRLAEGETTELNLHLSSEAVQIDPVEVVARSRRESVLGLDPRTIGGYIVPEDKIIAWRNTSRHAGDFLRKMNIPGLTVRDDIAAPRGRASFGKFPILCIQLGRIRSGGDQCRMVRVYLNDSPMADAEFTLLSLDSSIIERIILLRPNEAGVLFGTGSSNGVLLIYTRSGRW